MRRCETGADHRIGDADPFARAELERGARVALCGALVTRRASDVRERQPDGVAAIDQEAIKDEDMKMINFIKAN